MPLAKDSALGIVAHAGSVGHEDANIVLAFQAVRGERLVRPETLDCGAAVRAAPGRRDVWTTTLSDPSFPNSTKHRRDGFGVDAPQRGRP